MFALQIPRGSLQALAAAYSDPREAAALRAAASGRARGALTRSEFLDICEWKTRGRPRRHYEKNSEAEVREASAFALQANAERLRIGILRALPGVEWPVASAVLHLLTEEHPILDFRALEALGVRNKTSFNFEFWWAYVEFCRSLSAEAGLTMRDLDRGLWEASNQGLV